MLKNEPVKNIASMILIIITFVLGGTGLAILYNSKGDLLSVVGGFTCIAWGHMS